MTLHKGPALGGTLPKPQGPSNYNECLICVMKLKNKTIIDKLRPSYDYEKWTNFNYWYTDVKYPQDLITYYIHSDDIIDAARSDYKPGWGD